MAKRGLPQFPPSLAISNPLLVIFTHLSFETKRFSVPYFRKDQEFTFVSPRFGTGLELIILYYVGPKFAKLTGR